MSDQANAQSPVELIRLKDTDLTVVAAEEDIRRRTVVDKGGEEIGKVDTLLIDSGEQKVRFVEISEGGFLGIGDHKVLIPVDAISKVDEKHVYIDQSRKQVGESPRYDPDIATKADWGGLYGYYGYSPYWTAGYMYPAFPYYGR